MRLLLGLLAVLLLTSAYAQSNRALNLSLGWRQLRPKDEASSALVYRGQLPTLGLQWQRENARDYWHGQAQLSYGAFYPQGFPQRELVFLDRNEENGIDTVRVSARGKNLLVRADLGYLHKLGAAEPGNRDWQAWGATLTEEIYYPQGFVTPGMLNAVTLAPQAVAAFGVGSRGHFQVGIAIPVAALTTRLPYHQTVSQPGGTPVKGFFEQGTRLTSLNQYRQFRLHLGYRYLLNDRWQMGLHYEYVGLRHTTPRDLSVQQHAIQAFIGRHSYRSL